MIIPLISIQPKLSRSITASSSDNKNDRGIARRPIIPSPISLGSGSIRVLYIGRTQARQTLEQLKGSSLKRTKLGSPAITIGRRGTISKIAKALRNITRRLSRSQYQAKRLLLLTVRLGQSKLQAVSIDSSTLKQHWTTTYTKIQRIVIKEASTLQPPTKPILYQ